MKNSLHEKGYYEFENYLNKEDIKLVKETLISSLNYISKSKQKNLQKKYYEVKKYNDILKSHWYDICKYNIDLLKVLHKDEMLSFVKKFYKSKVIYSGRPAIHVNDNANDRLLAAHQETNQFSVDHLVLWIPIFDTNEKTGGMFIYENSHKNGFFKHSVDHPDGKKTWTKKYTNIHSKYLSKFSKKNLNVKAGNAILFVSTLVHGSYLNKDKKSVRITITERFNPLKKLPYLQSIKAPLKIPYTGVNYNKVRD